ncbi:ABC transporter substrate-binding protein [Pseudactinotalea sp.]|uniref:ABC transporter substrate-binding protein n=1 Tax=Pseudactinotalea sp. TaxID=1926260 RepID=UPI003B3A4FC2
MASRKRRVWAAAGAVAAAALALSACNGGGGGEPDAGEDVTLLFTFWGDNSRADRYEEAIDLFTAEHPNVTIQTQFSAMSDYWTARNTEGAAGSLPDVVQMDLPVLDEFVSRQWLLPLDEYMGETIDVSTISEGLLPAAQLNGETYGIPTGQSTLAVFVDNDVVDTLGVAVPEAPLTWDDYDEYLAEIAAAGADSDPVVYGSTNYTKILVAFQMWLQQEGLEFFDDSGALAFEPQDLTRWWERSVPNFANGAFIPLERSAQIEGDGIASGQIGADISWSNFLTRFTEGSAGHQYTMLPVPSNTEQSGMFLKPGLLLSISQHSENPDVAAEFVDFITNSPEVGAIFGFSRGVPASSAALEGVEQNELDVQTAEYEQGLSEFLTGRTPPSVAGSGSIEAEFMRLADEIGYGTVTPEEAAEQWFTFAESTLG